MSYWPLVLNEISLTLNGRLCLDAINLQITKPGAYAIIGPNGSGKSLLLSVIAGLRVASGELHWRCPPKPPQITWLPTQAVLLKRSVLNNLLALLPRNKRKHAEDALAWAGIESWADRPATELSTGEQQLVAFARAKAIGASIYLIDEPYANLDPTVRKRLHQLMIDLKHHGATLIMTGHEQPIYDGLADYVFTLDSGRLLSSPHHQEA